MPSPRRTTGRLRGPHRGSPRGTGSARLEPAEPAEPEIEIELGTDESLGQAPGDGDQGTAEVLEDGEAPISGAVPSGRQRSGRRNVSRGVTTAGNRRSTAARVTATRQPRRIGLRAKFTLVMGGIIVVILFGLGLLMASKANTYLFSQKQHDGIEVAKLTAQLATSIVGEATHNGKDEVDYRGLRDHIEQAIRQATTWDIAGDEQTDILAVKINTPIRFSQLSNAGFGPDEDKTRVGAKVTTVFVPKSGQTVKLPPTIEVYPAIRTSGDQQTPIYRFKVRLDPALWGEKAGLDGPALDNEVPHVRVDINASSVDKALSNLFFAIIAGVVLAIAIAIAAANYLARMITQPLTLLVADMKIVAQGDLEHRTESRSNDEIGVLATEFDRMTQSLKEAQGAVVEQEKADYELSLAREVQRQLLPANPPDIPGYELASFYQGAKAVSGDYFDFIDLGDGKWGFIIADVSGKGIPGSMVMAVTRTVIRLIAVNHGANAHETLKETNRLIAKQIKRGMFVTSFYAVLDVASGHLTYACAGHNPMVIYRAAAAGYELAHGKGIALGFNEGPLFDKSIEIHETQLESGDAIVLYTDGFPEAMSEASEEFGDERFYQTIAKHGEGDVGSLITGLVNEVAEHRGEAEQSDDLTLLAVRRG